MSQLEGEDTIAGGPSQDDHGKSFGQMSPQHGNKKMAKPDDKQIRIMQEINQTQVKQGLANPLSPSNRS